MDYKSIARGVIRGTVNVPSSKSISHRCLILAALSGKPCVVRNPLRSDDLDITLAALQALGYEAVREGANDEDVRFTGKRTLPANGSPANGLNTPSEPVKLYMHHSGTSARLLTAVAAIQPFRVEVDGSHRMRERPMMDLFEPLEQLGAVLTHKNGLLPVTIERPITTGGRVSVNAAKSSQFLSALLQIAPFLTDGLEIIVDGEIASKSYSDMTITQMRRAGLRVEERANGYYVPDVQHYEQAEWLVEGDYSAASYPIAGAVITGGEVTIPNAERESLQGDSVIVDIAREFGAAVEWLPNGGGLRVRSVGALRGIDRDMNTCPDIVPTVAVMALFADTPTRLRNVEHLRYKESDRISAVLGNIERLGGSARMEGDAMVIEPVLLDRLHGATLPTFDDHRIAMCFALAGLRVEGVIIEDPACVAKSYPDFWQDVVRLCGGDSV